MVTTKGYRALVDDELCTQLRGPIAPSKYNADSTLSQVMHHVQYTFAFLGFAFLMGVPYCVPNPNPQSNTSLQLPLSIPPHTDSTVTPQPSPLPHFLSPTYPAHLVAAPPPPWGQPTGPSHKAKQGLHCFQDQKGGVQRKANALCAPAPGKQL